MAGFYGGRVPGAPGPPPPVGHPYPGVPSGPHRPSPWPTGIPGILHTSCKQINKV